MKSMKLTLFIASVLLILSFPNGSSGTTCTSSLTEFALFPNPIQVGQTAHIRAVANLAGLQGNITSGSIVVSVTLNGGAVLQLTNIPLCDSTSSIVCSSLGAGENALSFDYAIPKIPIGSYSINVAVTVGTWGTVCEVFTLNVTDPTQTTNQYYSYFQASIAGSAQFENSDVLYRTVGDAVQIGPIGYAPQAYAAQYNWGSFLSITGSQDVVTSSLNINNYVWGLYGNLTEIVYSQNTRNHTYVGNFYVGYVNAPGQSTLSLQLLSGTFTLVWSYTIVGSTVTFSNLVGSIEFSNDYGTVPSGWNPITVEKYGTMYVATNNNGVLSVSGNTTYCLSGNCPSGVIDNQIAGNGNANQGLSNTDIILIICLTVGTAIIVALIVIVALYIRRARKYELEDGIFSAARKPEYGNALVVDDIIQETREHGTSPMIPTLDRHPGDTDDDEDDLSEDESELSDRRRSRFSQQVGSPSRRRSPTPEERGRRESGRRRSRSNSLRRRSMSPPRRDDESSYYSDAGSSASRASSDENDD